MKNIESKKNKNKNKIPNRKLSKKKKLSCFKHEPFWTQVRLSTKYHILINLLMI